MVMKSEGQIKVFIVDDHELITDALKSRFNSDEELVFAGRAKDKEAFFERMKPEFDILLLDRILEDQELLTMIGEIKKKYSQTKVVILTGRDDLTFATKVLKNGASGYISKATSMDNICRSVKKIHNGSRALEIGPDYTDRTMYEEGIQKLTRREKQVLCLLSKGFDYKDIAEMLSRNGNKDIKPSTVEKHKGNAKEKLKGYGITNDISLGYWIAESNLVQELDFT